eukprot:TRINITY_DN1294_c0_g1_i1.p3 TRINITY_DN1294_c0_g1~~TRINITY_DN1294_c0_g1_i1.p3  ORF type:complete len:131 (-),score=2.55 TRINITY_DN1294_c0_g1_i1:25-417(-)
MVPNTTEDKWDKIMVIMAGINTSHLSCCMVNITVIINVLSPNSAKQIIAKLATNPPQKDLSLQIDEVIFLLLVVRFNGMVADTMERRSINAITLPFAIGLCIYICFKNSSSNFNSEYKLLAKAYDKCVYS